MSKLRKARGWTQAELAERAGLTQPYISQLERGDTSATLRTVYQIATALDCGPGDLFEPSEAHAQLLNLFDGLPDHQKDGALQVLRAYVLGVTTPSR